MEWERSDILRQGPGVAPPRRPNVRYLLPGIVLFVASFLLFMSVFLPLVMAPRVARLPLAPDSVRIAQGYGSYFAPSQGQRVISDVLTHTMTIEGDPEAGSADVAVWNSFASLEDLRPTVLPENRVISAMRERVALDRSSALPVRCCGADPIHEGVTYRFPFSTQPAEYQLWEPLLRDAVPASFVRADRLGTLPVYVFLCVVEPTQIGTEAVPGGLVGLGAPSVEAPVLHAMNRELWVEPRTGRIVHDIVSVRQTLQQQDGQSTPFTTLDLAWNDETVQEQVDLAAREIARLEGVSTILPLTALVAGAILFALGVILTVLARAGSAGP